MTDTNLHRLILCADDYAQSPAIDAAILQLIRLGHLSATSCMTLSPHWTPAAKQLTADIRAQADIGLHLDFTHFAGAHQATFSQDFICMSHPQLIMRCLSRTLNAKQVQAHISRQLDAFEQAMDTPPDYVDGHQHVHQLPIIREALIVELVKRYGHHPKAKQPWLRIACPLKDKGLKAKVIALLGATALQKLAQQHGLAYSPTLLGVYAFDLNAEDYAAFIQAEFKLLVQSSPQATGLPPVLMCHPAVLADADDVIGHARLQEWRVLQQPKMALAMQTQGIQLVKGSQC